MRIGFVGAGKMAEAIIAALLKAGYTSPGSMMASDINAERRALMRRRYGVRVCADNKDVPAWARTVFLAVKPQEIEQVLVELAPRATAGHLFVSIAAGKKTSFLESFLTRSRVVRIMPNLPAVVGEGMTALCAGKSATGADKRRVERMLRCFGRAVQLPERLFDAVTALSGSGPAFFCHVLIALTDGAAAVGLPRDAALLLAEQTMLGTARLLLDKSLDPRVLIQRVASPKGTTEAGLKVLKASGVSESLRRAVRAAALRSAELSR